MSQDEAEPAKGRQLAEFIEQQKAKGLKGRNLTREIERECARLGLVEDARSPRETR